MCNKNKKHTQYLILEHTPFSLWLDLWKKSCLYSFSRSRKSRSYLVICGPSSYQLTPKSLQLICLKVCQIMLKPTRRTKRLCKSFRIPIKIVMMNNSKIYESLIGLQDFHLHFIIYRVNWRSDKFNLQIPFF